MSYARIFDPTAHYYNIYCTIVSLIQPEMSYIITTSLAHCHRISGRDCRPRAPGRFHNDEPTVVKGLSETPSKALSK